MREVSGSASNDSEVVAVDVADVLVSERCERGAEVAAGGGMGAVSLILRSREVHG